MKHKKLELRQRLLRYGVQYDRVLIISQSCQKKAQFLYSVSVESYECSITGTVNEGQSLWWFSPKN